MKRDDALLRLLGKIIAAKRQELGISQEELAHRSSINRTYLGDIERGARNLAILNFIKIAKGLGMTPSKLLEAVEKEFNQGSQE